MRDVVPQMHSLLAFELRDILLLGISKMVMKCIVLHLSSQTFVTSCGGWERVEISLKPVQKAVVCR